MNDEAFASACRADLAGLDRLAEVLIRDIALLRMGEAPDMAAIEEHVRAGQHHAAELRRRIGEVAAEVGESFPAWTNRDELEACVDQLAAALARREADRPRRQLQRLAQALRGGRIVNRRTGKAVIALEEVRRAALAEVEGASRGNAPPTLPGPEQGESWLAWAWGLGSEALDVQLAGIQSDFPRLVQLVSDADPSQWDATREVAPPAAPSMTLAARSEPTAAPSPVEGPPASSEAEEESHILAPAPGSPGSPASSAEEPVSSTVSVATAPVAVPTSEALLPEADGKVASTVPVMLRKVEPPPVAPSAEEAAAAALKAPTPERFWLAREVVWHLVEREMMGVAAYLAGALDQLAPLMGPPLPAWLLRGVALAPCLRHPSGDVARHLQEELSAYSEQECFIDGGGWNDAIRLLLAAACLRTALLAPEAGAGRILKDLHFRQPQHALFNLCRAAAEFSDGRQFLDLQALKQTQDRVAWEERMARLGTEVRSWLDGAPHKTLKFQAATIIWQKWVREGPIHQALVPVLDPNFGRLNAEARLERRGRVAEWAAQLSDETWLRDRVDRDDNLAKKRRSVRIVGAPFDRIVDYSREAATLAQRWLDLEQTRPAPPDDFRLRQAGRFRQQFQELGSAVQQELALLAQADQPTAARAAAHSCRAALEDLYRLFDPNSNLSSEDGCVWRTLHAGLLRVPDLPVSGDGAPHEVEDADLVEAILRGVADKLPSWQEAFHARAERQDHQATALILGCLETAGASMAELEALRRRREEGLKESRQSLESDLWAARKQVEEAVAFGLLRGDERDEMMAQVQAGEARLAEVLRFGPEHARLATLRERIAGRRAEQVAQARRRVAESGLPADHPALPRIASVLDRGDVFSANDYLEMACRGEDLPGPVTAVDQLRAFFPERARELDDFLARKGPREFIRKLRAGDPVCGLDLSNVPKNLREQARDMLEAWFAASQRNRVTQDEVRSVFSGLGFTPLQVTLTQSGHIRAEVQTEPLRERSLCPLPAFGSAADGRYRVLCVWGRPSEQDLIGRVGETHAGAVLVFYFGRMTVQRRRDLARLRAEHRRTFVVLDDILLAYLCGERGSRLPVLFACGLPFTHADPYPAAASLVPPEMFYGRRRERDEVLNPFGSCFIYGGRQLGKTALLRDAERTFNRTSGHVAVWLDLKDARVGIDRDLWPFLADVLHEKGILDAKVPANVGPDRLLSRVQQWLDSDASRRVLLLLDEADMFLKKDSDGGEAGTAAAYSRVTKLKGLMDRTNRRFKVVFAGLHNVQRTTRLENHPLAHYGDPICIGPLLDNGEWREARDLIGRPLGALGYTFTSPDLVTRILSHTNYYPSLRVRSLSCA